jgi:hypothetical protein
MTTPGSDLGPRRTHRDERLPQSQDDHEPVPFSEVLCMDIQAAHAVDQRSSVVDCERGGPEQAARQPLNEGGDDQESRSGEEPGGEPEDGPARPRLLPRHQEVAVAAKKRSERRRRSGS